MPVTINGTSGAITGLAQLPDSTMASGSVLQLQSVTKTDTQSIAESAGTTDISGLSITITPVSYTHLTLPTIYSV